MLLSPLSVLVLLSSEVWSYEAPEDKQDVFATTACPAFLTFRNAAFLAGVTVELPCPCKPQEVQSVVWFFRKPWGSSDETRVLSDHHGNKLLDTSQVPYSSDLQTRFSIRLFSLLIFRAAPQDSGLYICGSATRDFFYGYDLDVQEVHTLSFAPSFTKESVKQKKRQSSRVDNHPLFQVFTSFQPWSVCDRCGVPGEQVRVGLCYIQSRFLHVRYSSASLPAPVTVFYLSHPADRVLTLGCPGARPNMAVAWDRGSKPIYRSEHASGGNVSVASPTLWIDTGHHLVFQPATTQDSGFPEPESIRSELRRRPDYALC